MKHETQAGPRVRAETTALDRAHIWAPYTLADTREREAPLVIVDAEGSTLIDADGRRYIDGNSSWWVAGLGHRHPRLCGVLVRQSGSLLHASLAGIAHPHAAALAAELCACAPVGLTRVFFSDDGSTAIETALKIAVQYWRQNGQPGRTSFLTLEGGYHGDTVGAMSVSGTETFRGAFAPLLFPTLRAPDPSSVGGWNGIADWIERALAENPDTVAGVLVEPCIQGAAGMRVWPASVLARIRRATTAVDTFLLCDEVFVGLGRTGTMWASEHAQISPDFLCAAKMLSGGILPFAATLCTERVYDGFRGAPERALLHGHSYCGNPLGAALARETLAIVRDECVLEGIGERARRIAFCFEDLATAGYGTNARALGMVGAIDLGSDGYGGARGWRVYGEALARGAYLRPLGDTVYIAPPLNIALADLDRLLGIVRDSVAGAAGAEAP